MSSQSPSPSPKSSPKSSPKVKSKSQVQKSSPKSEVLSLESRTWTLLTVLSLLHPPTTLNFSDTSRGPTTKCYTFLETSHDPCLRSQLRCKIFANFLQPYFANPQYEHSRSLILKVQLLLSMRSQLLSRGSQLHSRKSQIKSTDVFA